MTAAESDDRDEVVITNDQINSELCLSSVKSNSAGGISVFMGTTRDLFEGTVFVMIKDHR